MTIDTHPTGSRAFMIVWFGQLVSVTGTSVTGFGLSLFIFTDTRSVTQLAFVTLALTVPAVLLSPLAGTVADRFDRRMVMLLSDTAAAASTLTLALIFLADALELWHVLGLVAIGSGANAFQSPAWLASIPLLVPKDQLGRANGLVQLNDALSIVLAPALAGALLAGIGLEAVLFLDVATFLIGVITLALVRFPRADRVDEASGSVRTHVAFAWRYLRDRPGLFWLLWVYGGVNFSLSFGNVLFIPLVLSFSTEAAAGAVLSAAGVGAVIGSVVVSAWGGPKRHMRGIMLGIAAGGVMVGLAGVWERTWWIGLTAFLLLAVVPVVNTSSQVVWQTKVAPGVQGRVFALRRMIAQAIAPIAVLLAGPLADGVFEPLMESSGSLAGSVGAVIGTGPGRGIGLMYVITGGLTVAIAVAGWLYPRIRHLERELPDQIE